MLQWPTLRQATWLFARFDGRISRQVYWLAYFFLNIVPFIIARIIPDLFFHVKESPTGEDFTLNISLTGFILGLVFMASLMAISAKRFHDIDVSARYLVVIVLAVIATMVLGGSLNFSQLLFVVALFVIGFVPGSSGPNRFGDQADKVP